jgi:hypothetical protein
MILFFFSPRFKSPPKAVKVIVVGNAGASSVPNNVDDDNLYIQYKRNNLTGLANNNFILTENFPFFNRKYNEEDIAYAFDKVIDKRGWDWLLDKEALNLLIFDSSELFASVIAAKIQNKIYSNSLLGLPVVLKPILDETELTQQAAKSFEGSLQGEKTRILCKENNKILELISICRDQIKTQLEYQSAIESKLKEFDEFTVIKDSLDEV